MKMFNRLKILAWSVHLFTASGMIVGFKALEMAYTGQTYQAIIWLLLAVFIDGIDGTFARLFKVKEILPTMDGKMIDFVVDFVNFVITPTVIFYHEKMVPNALLFPAVAGILIASLYHYGNKNQVTSDYRFNGFPAFWNLIIYYLFILKMDEFTNLIVISVFILLHFLPVKFLYISRLRINIIVTAFTLIVLITANTIVLTNYPNTPFGMRLFALIPILILFILGMVNQEIFPSLALNKKK